MICLDNTDVIEGGASVDAVIDYQIHGLVGTTFTQLAAGVMDTTLTTVLCTAGAVISVVSIILVNKHTSAVNVTLCLDPANGGNPRYIIPKTVSLGAGYSLHTDGARFGVYNANGELITSITNAVTAAANITDNRIVRGNGGVKGVQESLGAISDTGVLSGIVEITGLTTPLTVAQGGSGTTGDSIIKVWIRFNGIGTIAIQDSFNVASITDEGTGHYTVTIDTDFANNDFAVNFNANSLSCWIQATTVGTVEVYTVDADNNAIDVSLVFLIAIGDQ